MFPLTVAGTLNQLIVASSLKPALCGTHFVPCSYALRSIVTPGDVAAQGSRAALLDGSHHAMMMDRHAVRTMVGRTILTEDVSDFGAWT